MKLKIGWAFVERKLYAPSSGPSTVIWIGTLVTTTGKRYERQFTNEAESYRVLRHYYPQLKRYDPMPLYDRDAQRRRRRRR